MGALRKYRWLIVPVMLGGVVFVVWNVNRAATSPPVDSGGSSDAQYVLYAVDSGGAIVASQKDVRGVDRSGKTRWTEVKPYINYVCSPSCPNAVVSGSDESLNSELATDPPPRLLGGGSVPETFTAPVHGKNQIVSATPKSAIRLTTKQGHQVWEISNTGSRPEARAIPGFAVAWYPNSNNSAAVGISRSVGSRTNEAQLFVRRGDVWQFSGQSLKTDQQFACVADGAASFFTDAQHLINRANERTVALGGEPGRISNCAFTRNSLATIQYVVNESEERTAEVQLYELDGKPGRHFAVSGSDPYVDADVNGELLSLFDGNTVRVVTVAGKDVAKIYNVDSALFDELGELVTVSKDGQVEWHKF